MPRAIRSTWGYASLAGAALIWIALLGPVIALLTHLSRQRHRQLAHRAWRDRADLVSLAAGRCHPGRPAPARHVPGLDAGPRQLPYPRVWEAGVLCSLLLPPLVIGLLLIFMIGPFTWIGAAARNLCT